MNDTYDPAQFNFSFNGYLISGYADGTYLEVERGEDAWTEVWGADGEFARARNRNEGGTIKLTLLQTSTSNDFLTAQHALDLATGAGTGAALGKDLLGRTAFSGGDCYIKRYAKVSLGKGIEGREWTILVPKLDVVVGGNGPT